jgi:phosphomethylpyrimidine synthase
VEVMREAKKGNVTEEMQIVATDELIDVHLLMERIADGEIVILKNNRREAIHPVGVGKGLRTKVNANIGTSTDSTDIQLEIEKARTAVQAGADTIMDLSTGGDIRKIRNDILDRIPVVLGTVPIYQAAIQSIQSKGALVKMDADTIFSVLEEQAEEGVDFFTVHCGVTQASVERLQKEGRLMDIVSRGGSFLVTWMIANEKENPLYEQYDRVLEIAAQYDIVLSLGDGLRPGSIVDATDRAQVEELILLGELTERARKRDVQVIIEGPGHVPLNQIKMNVQLEKEICHNAPFYVLGPLVTDVAPGYDHITSAIGGAIAAAEGADFLCYVTPSEHLKLPDCEDVRKGVIATRIAGHAADIVKEIPNAVDWDIEMSKARKQLDWDAQISHAIDPIYARQLREQCKSSDDEICSMCGEYCAIKMVQETLKQFK